jgi:hypothetical protein
VNREEFAKSFAKDIQRRLLLAVNHSVTKALKWSYDNNKSERIVIMIKGETFMLEYDTNVKA